MGPGNTISEAGKLKGVDTYADEGTDAFGFMACELTNGTTLLFEEEHPDTSNVKTGDQLRLEIAEKPAAATVGARARDPACNRQACQRKQWSIRAMRNPTRLARERKEAGPEHGHEHGHGREHEHGHEHGRGRRAVRDGPRSMLMINVGYLGSGGEPSSYCGEGCMAQNAWTGQGTLDGMIRESSYGKVQFPQSQGRVVSTSTSRPSPTAPWGR